jgi:hypothetical protein
MENLARIFLISLFFLSIEKQSISGQPAIFLFGQGFGLVVIAAGWLAGNLGSILGRDGFYSFACIPQRFEYALA